MPLFKSGEARVSAFEALIIFVLGLLIASNGFLIWQYMRLTNLSEGLRTDTVNIIQAYNNLVTTLQQQGAIKVAPVQPGSQTK